MPMRISELAGRAGISVATVKYYLREGLLQGGVVTGPNQASYGDDHLHRLRLIRALREVGGLEIRAIRAVVEAIEDEGLPRHELLGVAQRALAGTHDRSPSPEVDDARRAVDEFIAGLGWNVATDAPGRRDLADALVALTHIGRHGGTALFRPYAAAADAMAAWEVRTIPTGEQRAEAVEQLVVGTVVFEAVFAALRRLAHEHHSSLRYASSPD
jgi:DNA-binding transcriptional MerR regulator